MLQQLARSSRRRQRPLRRDDYNRSNDDTSAYVRGYGDYTRHQDDQHRDDDDNSGYSTDNNRGDYDKDNISAHISGYPSPRNSVQRGDAGKTAPYASTQAIKTVSGSSKN